MTGSGLLRTQNLKWVPNALTISRAVLAVCAFAAALHGAWVMGFWLLVVALSTDFLDGLAAKKLNAKSKLGAELDGLADSAIVVTGMLSLSITGHVAWWFTAVILGIGMAIGSDRVLNQPVWKWRAAVAVVCVFISWIGIIWFYADLAFGWSWVYVPFTIAVLAICASLKRHRIRAWLGG